MSQGEFRVGDALGKGFSIWFRNLPAFMVLAMLVYTPVLAYTAVVLSGDLGEDKLRTWGWIMPLISLPLDFVVTAAVLYGTIQQLRGHHVGIGESIGVGLRRLLPVVGVGVVSGLAVIGGLFLFIVPGIILFCMFYVAVPVAVVERAGVTAALRRSRELTAGYKASIFGIYVVIQVLAILVNLTLQSALQGADPSVDDTKTAIWFTVGAEIVLSALKATINGVVYHDLRVAKEGMATDDLARVFD